MVALRSDIGDLLLAVGALSRGMRHSDSDAVSRSQEYPAHRALHRAGADQVQEFLEGLSRNDLSRGWAFLRMP
jgi:hypothetical protein